MTVEITLTEKLGDMIRLGMHEQAAIIFGNPSLTLKKDISYAHDGPYIRANWKSVDETRYSYHTKVYLRDQRGNS